MLLDQKRLPAGGKGRWTRHLRGRNSRWLLALFFSVAGILHFVFPAAYMAVMPPWLGWHAALVAVSGIAEIAGGLGVLPRSTRRWAGIGLLLLCVAVLPANVQMLLDAVLSAKAPWLLALLVVRLPLQVVLMAWIWIVTRSPGPVNAVP
jgi:uncharacterized membrane protein